MINDGDVGYSYESVFDDVLAHPLVTDVEIEDAYIRVAHQVRSYTVTGTNNTGINLLVFK